MIYFIRDTGTGHIKIGFSDTPWARLSQIQTHCPSPVEMLGVIEGDRTRESAIHAVFSDLPRRGEWFCDSGDIAATIETYRREGRLLERPQRKPKGLLRPTDLAMAMGLTVGGASLILSGRRLPSLELAVRIEARFGIPCSYWIRRTGAFEDAA